MNSEELKVQLVRETQAKNQSVELAKIALMNTAENFRKELTESATSYRADLRDEMKKAREAWEETTKNDRQKWERVARQAEARIAATKQRYIIWGSIALLLVALMTAGLTVGLTWASVDKGTGSALSHLQQIEAEKLADLRAQVVTAQNEMTAAKKTLSDLKVATNKQEQLLAEAKERASHIKTMQGRNGEIFVEVAENAKIIYWNGKSIVSIKQN